MSSSGDENGSDPMKYWEIIPRQRNLSASVSGLNDPLARGQYRKTLCR
jgi:hypothetical protein